MFKAYLNLTKPGIIMGNVISAAAGFFLASHGQPNLTIFIATMIGTAFIIGASCVFNNYIDRDIDKKMDRTKNRALAKGSIPVVNALSFGGVLGILGFLILFMYTNLITVFIGLVGVVFYVVLYGIAKRRSIYGTLVGSVSGATPIVAGYTAVTNSFDLGALLLFIILVVWQMPHFYAIAIYRLEDYKNAKIPVLPAVAGIRVTKLHILAYAFAFLVATYLLARFGYTGYVYLGAIFIFELNWLVTISQGFRTKDIKTWSRNVFKYSLVVLTIFCLLISFDSILR
ncbi:MAG TPA: heme o synthase [Patescibacteria group bacterium]|nr:heme o synthase [Patescibacteria group bacterium]